MVRLCETPSGESPSRRGLVARPTGAPAAPSIGVVGRKWMPIQAMRLSLVGCRDGVSSKDVLSVRHRFQVGRVHASTITAQMVNDESIRDRTYEMFVGKAVNLNCAPVFQSEAVVPLVVGATLKEPASGRSHNAGLKPLHCRPAAISGSNYSWVTVLTPTPPVLGAPSPGYGTGHTSIDRTGRLIGHLGLILRGVMRQAVPPALPPFIISGAHTANVHVGGVNALIANSTHRGMGMRDRIFSRSAGRRRQKPGDWPRGATPAAKPPLPVRRRAPTQDIVRAY